MIGMIWLSLSPVFQPSSRNRSRSAAAFRRRLSRRLGSRSTMSNRRNRRRARRGRLCRRKNVRPRPIRQPINERLRTANKSAPAAQRFTQRAHAHMHSLLQGQGRPLQNVRQPRNRSPQTRRSHALRPPSTSHRSARPTPRFRQAAPRSPSMLNSESVTISRRRKRPPSRSIVSSAAQSRCGYTNRVAFDNRHPSIRLA